MYTRRYTSFLRLEGYSTPPPMYFFIIWIHRMWTEYKRVHPEAHANCSGMVEYQDHFDSWLEGL